MHRSPELDGTEKILTVYWLVLNASTEYLDPKYQNFMYLSFLKKKNCIKYSWMPILCTDVESAVC